jgi:hypothetical protein
MGLQHPPKASFLKNNLLGLLLSLTRPKTLVLWHWINLNNGYLKYCSHGPFQLKLVTMLFILISVREGLVHKMVCCLRAWRLTRAAAQISMPPNNITSHVTRPSPPSFLKKTLNPKWTNVHELLLCLHFDNRVIRKVTQ